MNGLGQRKWKEKVEKKREKVKEVLKKMEEGITMIDLIQELVPLGLKAIQEELFKEIESLAGKRYEHGKENTRWGSQWGSIYLQDQKVPMEIPRVRNKANKREIKLKAYEQLQEPYRNGHQAFIKLLNGLTTHNYREAAALAPEVFGLSASSVSKNFKKKAETYFELLQERRLDGYDFVAMFIDGKRFAQEGIMVSLGITLEGKKIILGIEQMSAENQLALIQFFNKLIERGFKHEEGLLFIVDGSKGLIKAIRERFGAASEIQRCQFHKRENVVSYLAPEKQKIIKAKLMNAYNELTYSEAKESLLKIKRELDLINPSAAKSLAEGLEETLTLHRLGVHQELKISFSTTNCIESLMSQIGQYTDKVDYWQNGAQIMRWVAASLLQIEPRLRKVKGFHHLAELRLRLKQGIEKGQVKPISLREKEETLAASLVAC